MVWRIWAIMRRHFFPSTAITVRSARALPGGENFGKLAEGVPTLEAVKLIADRENIDMPICQALYKVIYEKADIKKTIREMFNRDLKQEFEHIC